MDLRDLNYHQLLCFWHIAREGSMVAAARRLRLRQPTLSIHVANLEKTLGGRLFHRVGNKLELTELGKSVRRRADVIFSASQELLASLAGQEKETSKVVVGLVESFPRLVAFRILQRFLKSDKHLRISCRTGQQSELLVAVLDRDIDVLLTDVAGGRMVSPKCTWRKVGTSALALYAPKEHVAALRRQFPHCLAGKPILLPGADNPLRAPTEDWLEEVGVRMEIAGEFEDTTLLKTFGGEGLGYFIMPLVEAHELRKLYGVHPVRTIPGLAQEYYAVFHSSRKNDNMIERFLDVVVSAEAPR